MLLNDDLLSPMFDALARRVRKSCAFGSAPVAPPPFSRSNMGSQARSPSTAALKRSWRRDLLVACSPSYQCAKPIPRRARAYRVDPISCAVLTAVAASGVSMTRVPWSHKVRHSRLIENKSACPDLAERDAGKSTDFDAAA